jgi:hypothetical protein
MIQQLTQECRLSYQLGIYCDHTNSQLNNNKSIVQLVRPCLLVQIPHFTVRLRNQQRTAVISSNPAQKGTSLQYQQWNSCKTS